MQVERHESADDAEKLSLYLTPSCPYCHIVLRVIDELGIQDRIELRDLWSNPTHREELLGARGRGTVPVLRLQSAEDDRWMPESRDIMRYLRARFGDG